MDKYDLLEYAGIPKKIRVFLPELGLEKSINKNLYFTGPVGSGKSVKAASILTNKLFEEIHTDSQIELLDPRSDKFDPYYQPFFIYRYKFVNVPRLLQDIKKTFNQKDKINEYDLIDKCCQVDLLVLDDLGSELATDWAYQTLYLIISERYDEMRQTIFTSNLSPSELGKHFTDERLISRIIEMCGKQGIIKLSGKNYRKF